ncbi:MAG: phosphoribosyltransferase family protein [Candidatus Aenigmatarchaeota archaeon]
MSFEERVKIYKNQNSYKIKICGLERELPIRQVEKGLWVASNHRLVLGRDLAFTKTVGKELAFRIKPYEPECLLTAESKSLPLVYEVARKLEVEMCVCRKEEKAYMGEKYLEINIKSITTGKPQRLILEDDEAKRLKNKRVCLIDDVVSTYGTMQGLEKIALKAEGKVVCKACVWLEGPWYRGEDLIYLGILPIFVLEEEYKRMKKLYCS